MDNKYVTSIDTNLKITASPINFKNSAFALRKFTPKDELSNRRYRSPSADAKIRRNLVSQNNTRLISSRKSDNLPSDNLFEIDTLQKGNISYDNVQTSEIDNGEMAAIPLDLNNNNNNNNTNKKFDDMTKTDELLLMSPITKGFGKLDNIKRELGLDTKKVNILNPKVLESWINETLLEVERQETKNNIMITSEKRIPLRKFGIDRSSLEGMGLPKEKIDRLYRSLFVYSAGFYELIAGMFDHTMKKFHLVGSVWKVFWILLEYCYKPDHQTILEEITKENEELIERLRADLELKKKEIGAFEKWRDEVLQKLTNDLNSLQMEKENLFREKLHLEEENKISDKAYSEEVKLRLKFESKINEIYAFHRDLKSKYSIACEELAVLKKERETDILAVAELKNDIAILTNKNTELTFGIKNLTDRLASKEILIEDQNKLILELEYKLSNSLKLNEDIEYKKSQYTYDDINFKAKTFAIINESLKQNIEQLHKLLDKANKDKEELEEKNKNMKYQLDDKILQMTTLELNIVKINNDLALKTSQYEIIQSEYMKCKEEKENFENEVVNLKATLEYEIEKGNKLKTEKDTGVDMIRNMEKARSEALTSLNKAEEKIVILIKDLEIHSKRYIQIEDAREKLNITVTELQDRILALKDDLENKEQELNETRIQNEEMKREFKHLLETEKNNTNNWIGKYRTEVETVGMLTQKIIELEDKIKNETFLRKNISNKIEDMERVLKEERGIRLQKASMVAELQKDIDVANRDILKYRQLYEEALAKGSNQSNKITDYYKSIIQKLKTMHYPMIYEDLCSRIREYEDKMKIMKKEIDKYKFENDELNIRLSGCKEYEDQTELKIKNEKYKNEMLAKKNNDLEQKYLESEAYNEIIKNKNDNLLSEIHQLKFEVKCLKDKLIVYSKSEAPVSFRQHEKFLDYHMIKKHFQESHELDSTFYDDAGPLRTLTGTSGTFQTSFSQIKRGERHSDDLSILSKSIVQCDKEIQSEDDRIFLDTDTENPLKADQFLVEDKKLIKVDQIMNIAAKQAFYGLQRRGISFTPEAKPRIHLDKFRPVSQEERRVDFSIANSDDENTSKIRGQDLLSIPSKPITQNTPVSKPKIQDLSAIKPRPNTTNNGLQDLTIYGSKPIIFNNNSLFSQQRMLEAANAANTGNSSSGIIIGGGGGGSRTTTQNGNMIINANGLKVLNPEDIRSKINNKNPIITTTTTNTTAVTNATSTTTNNTSFNQQQYNNSNTNPHRKDLQSKQSQFSKKNQNEKTGINIIATDGNIINYQNQLHADTKGIIQGSAEEYKSGYSSIDSERQSDRDSERQFADNTNDNEKDKGRNYEYEEMKNGNKKFQKENYQSKKNQYQINVNKPNRLQPQAHNDSSTSPHEYDDLRSNHESILQDPEDNIAPTTPSGYQDDSNSINKTPTSEFGNIINKGFDQYPINSQINSYRNSQINPNYLNPKSGNFPNESSSIFPDIMNKSGTNGSGGNGLNIDYNSNKQMAQKVSFAMLIEEKKSNGSKSSVKSNFSAGFEGMPDGGYFRVKSDAYNSSSNNGVEETKIDINEMKTPKNAGFGGLNKETLGNVNDMKMIEKSKGKGSHNKSSMPDDIKKELLIQTKMNKMNPQQKDILFSLNSPISGFIQTPKSVMSLQEDNPNMNMIQILDKNLNKSIDDITNHNSNQNLAYYQQEQKQNKGNGMRTFVEKKDNILSVFDVKRNENIKDGIKKAIKLNRLK